MLRSMTIRQWEEWKEFASLEPFGEDREDARMGMVVQVLANAYRNSKKRAAPWKLAECVPTPTGDAFAPKRAAWQDMKAIARQWVEHMKGEE